MIQRTQERLRLKPERIAGDTAYGTGRLLDWLVEQNIAPHIPVWDPGTSESLLGLRPRWRQGTKIKPCSLLSTLIG
jgi:hypothetical protein